MDKTARRISEKEGWEKAGRRECRRESAVLTEIEDIGRQVSLKAIAILFEKVWHGYVLPSKRDRGGKPE